MTDQEILELLEEVDRPFLKSKDLKRRFNISHTQARRRLDSIQELKREKIGASAVIWYHVEWQDGIYS